MLELADRAYYDHRDTVCQKAICAGFELLLYELMEHGMREEVSSDTEIDALIVVPSGTAAEQAELIEDARDESVRASGFRIARLDEIKALQQEFAASGEVAPETVKKSMELFLNMTLRSLLCLYGDNEVNVESQSKRVATYTKAYDALSIDGRGARVWYPFDDFSM